ncbi:MAG: molybdopterin-dependent oxidoreductase, partial [Chloroflexota bacterium]|nr:molybdopterin-dependent oxidoreductase [Chloroflexota bacterium]
YQGSLDEALVSRFLRAVGTPNALNETSLHRANKEKALELAWGVRGDLNDVAHATYILNFGSNPYESHALFVPFVQRIIEARQAGAKLITFDPRLSTTAGKSDEWFPIKPGTDGLVALAMANVIMQLGLHDADFLARWVNYPAVKLAEHLTQYSLEMAGAASGVKPAHIRRLAIEFATTRPATAISAGGVSLHANGVQNERAILLLNALTGNVDVRGGYCLPRTYGLEEPNPRPPAPTLPSSLSTIQQALPLIRDRQQKVGMLLTYRYDPVYGHPDSNLSAAVLKDESLIRYHVAVDSYLTESASLADLFLPAATYLESWNIHSMPAYELVPFVGLQQPVVEPAGESRPFHDICLELAKRVGGGMEQ